METKKQLPQSYQSSHSSVQRFGSIDMTKPGIKASDIFRHPLQWFKYRLTGDNLIGTGMDVFYVISMAELAKAGWDKTQLRFADPSRLIAGAIGVSIGLWSLVSPRGARDPEGDSPMAKAMDILKHPQESAVQFGWLLSIPMHILLIGGNVKEGLALKGNCNPELSALGNARLRQAFEKAIGVVLVNSNLFTNTKKPDTSNKSAASNPSVMDHKEGRIERIKNIYVNSVKEYPILTLARVFLMASQIELIKEGKFVNDLNQRGLISNGGGDNLIKSGRTGVISRLLTDYYSSARLYDSNSLTR